MLDALAHATPPKTWTFVNATAMFSFNLYAFKGANNQICFIDYDDPFVGLVRGQRLTLSVQARDSRIPRECEFDSGGLQT